MGTYICQLVVVFLRHYLLLLTSQFETMRIHQMWTESRWKSGSRRRSVVMGGVMMSIRIPPGGRISDLGRPLPFPSSSSPFTTHHPLRKVTTYQNLNETCSWRRNWRLYTYLHVHVPIVGTEVVSPATSTRVSASTKRALFRTRYVFEVVGGP